MCDRWDALARHLTHLDKATIRRLITDHTTLGCPECSGYTSPRYLPRDPHQETR